MKDGLASQQVFRVFADSGGNVLNISVNTVRDYIRSIYEKLHVHSKSEAVGKALRSRLIY